MSVNQGIFNSGQFAQDHAKLSFAAMITRLMPNGSAPLFGLTSMLAAATAVNTQHGFFTKTMVFPSFDLAANISDSDTIFTVSSTEALLPGQIHRLQETGENVIVDQVISPTQVKVTRAVGTVAAAAVTISTDTVVAYQVGNAYEEASLRPQAMSIKPVQVTNLTQIFRNTWAISGTAEAVQVIAGDTTVAENRQDCAAFHAADIEKALFFGQKSSGVRNGQPFRTMDGLVNIVGNIAYYPPSYSAPNIYPAGATTTYEELEGMLDPCFDQATDPKVANERLLFTGGTGLRVINNIGRITGQYQLIDGQTSWGLQFRTLKTTRGTFRLIEHPLFNSNPHWAAMAVAVDLTTFNIAYLGNRKTQNREFNMDGKPVDQGIDAVGGTLTTECTCEVKNPPANAIITGLTAPSL
tara:strand:+ start:17257 stop:18486 length:1230 start_codon:yes stop_codon:yes gene_type:complete